MQPLIKSEGDQVIVIAPGVDGVRRINATGERFMDWLISRLGEGVKTVLEPGCG